MISVRARFAGNTQDYSYFAHEEDRPEIGDFILTSVDLKEERELTIDNDGLTTSEAKRIMERAMFARIVAVDDIISRRATKFYLKLIKVEEIVATQKRNRAVWLKAKAQKEAREKLERMLTEQAARERYATLAASNPEVAELIKILED